MLVEYTYDEFDDVCILSGVKFRSEMVYPERDDSHKIPYYIRKLLHKFKRPEFDESDDILIGSEFYFFISLPFYRYLEKIKLPITSPNYYVLVLERLLAQPYYFNRFIVTKYGIVGFKRTLYSLCSSKIYADDKLFNSIKYLVSLSSLMYKGWIIKVNEYKVDVSKLNPENISNSYGLSIESILLLDGKHNTYGNVSDYSYTKPRSSGDNSYYRYVYKVYNMTEDEVKNEYGDYIITV